MESSRRRFLQLSAAGAVQARPDDACRPSFLDRRSGAHPYCASPRSARPHVFVISVDMISPDHWMPSRADGEAMQLPALRSLWADSVFFTNAFCTNPLCAPARAALLTGRSTYILSNNERAHDGHASELRSTDSIFPEYLKAAGYDTRHCGKGHLGAQKFFDAFGENADGWDRWDPPVRSDENYLAHLRGLGVQPQRYRRELFGLQPDRRSPANSFGGWIEQPDGRDFPVAAQYSHFLASRAVSKLDSALASSRPVYLQLDFFDPHQPFSIPAGFEAREKALRAAFRLPASYLAARQRDFQPDPALPRIYDTYTRYWGLYDSRTVEDYRVANALQMEVADLALARFVAELKRRGIYDESLILFTSDHGEMNGRRALVDKGVYLHPEVLRVPLAIKMPRSAGIAPRLESTPVSHLDVAPTLLEVAGMRSSERLDGVSLLPLLKGQAHNPKPYIAECGWHVGVNFACGMHDGRHFYSYNLSSNISELYDLQDPDPINLAALPGHAATKDGLARRLGAFLESDPRWQCYWSSFRIDHWSVLPRPKGDTQLQQH